MTAATALRLRRPRWKDPRLLIGIALVLLSVLTSMLVIGRLAATTPVLVARSDIVVGDTIGPEDVTTVELRLGDETALYASRPDQIPTGAVAVESVRKGELVPLAVIGQGEGVQLRPVVLEVGSSVAASVGPGAHVEVWHTPVSQGGDERATAQRLVDDGIVRSVDEGSSLGMRSMTIEILVPAEDVPTVLEALAADDRMDVIAIPGAREART
ncbi:SAF domain-containing protein [Brachybacterium huguangmaarense]